VQASQYLVLIMNRELTKTIVARHGGQWLLRVAAAPEADDSCPNSQCSVLMRSPGVAASESWNVDAEVVDPQSKRFLARAALFQVSGWSQNQALVYGREPQQRRLRNGEVMRREYR
jgi:hypothetical protein